MLVQLTHGLGRTLQTQTFQTPSSGTLSSPIVVPNPFSARGPLSRKNKTHVPPSKFRKGTKNHVNFEVMKCWRTP